MLVAATVPVGTPEAVEQDYSHPDKKKRKEGPKRPLGRPKGSGPKQRAAQENQASTPTLLKRPVGRPSPRKVMTHGSGTSTRAISGLVSIDPVLLTFG
jgi:hypothetical protein